MTFLNLFETRPRWLDAPLLWCVFAVMIASLDYLSGPFIAFPVMFLFPILGSSLFCSRGWAFGLALVLPGARLGYSISFWRNHWGLFESLVNFHIYVLVFLLVAALMDYIRRQTEEIRTLKDILPMCSFCRRIRDENGAWHSLEKYIELHGETRFSHGFCQECGEKHYGDFMKRHSGGKG